MILKELSETAVENLHFEEDPLGRADASGDDEQNGLEAAVIRQLDLYFARLEGRDPHPLYELVVHAVERPLIEYAMSMCHHNQCAAAQLLGINRNTLRKKLQDHGMLSARRTSTKLKEK